MKSRIWMMGLGVCLALGGAWPSHAATTYYVNDTYVPGADIYTTATGNDANSGTTSNAPKATVGNVIGTCSLQPGDVVYIDTGTYAPAIISNTVVGVAGTNIVFQGSTNFAAGGTVFTGGEVDLTVSGRYLTVSQVRLIGGLEGIRLSGAHNCEFAHVWAISNTLSGITMPVLSNSNRFRRCVSSGGGNALRITVQTIQGNYFENSIFRASGVALYLNTLNFSNMVGCVVGGSSIFIVDSYVPAQGERNLFWGMTNIASNVETLADLQRLKSGWRGNTCADPKFANADALDFHLLSASGFVSNGVWTTNAAVGYSPAIDFGHAAAGVGDEPAPNGSRVNIGLYGGTAEASKSRMNDWLFAMAFNDGGSVIQTGRLEWVGGNLGAGATVNLQFSTNSGTSWSDIATGVAATNESYTWVPAVDHPMVLWRVVSSTNPAAASTNAKPFSVRTSTNTTFRFYVNDGSTADGIHCSAVGDNANSGIASNLPKRSLQAILDAYDLEGGDTVYVDTGDYATNFTTTITAFDSGVSNVPVRIIGSPKGAVFNRSHPSANTWELNGAVFLEIEDVRLAGGGSGLAANGAYDISLRRVQFMNNQFGVTVAGAGFLFENCLSANNSVRAYVGPSAGANRWLNGVMWGSPTLIHAASNALTVSNSVLGNGTALFGSQVVGGDHNVVWSTGVGLTYATFAAFQNAGLGMGWERSAYLDPQFANAAGGDFHLKSVMGRYDTNVLAFVTNDAVHSPAIDFGDPAAPVSNEPSPNGSRLNAGMFGGSAQASKSRTNAWLQALSFMDGGTLDAQVGAWLRWNGDHFNPDAMVTIWLSRDNGASWTNLAVTNAVTGAYWYQNLSTNDPSSLYAMWKIELEDADPPVSSQSTTNFYYKNGPYLFYVNDGSTNGDVYCETVGSDTNLGVSADTPMANLHALVSRYQLGPGDRVYVDTGEYTATNTVVLTSQDSGLATNPVVIAGSTNRLSGGSQFGRRTGTPMAIGFVFLPGASNIALQHIVLTNVTRGVAMTNAAGITLENIEVRGAASRAFDLQGNSRSNQLLRCVAHGGGTGVYLNQATNILIRHSVFWQNSVNAVSAGSQVGVWLENSVLGSTNLHAALFSLTSTSGFFSDYNAIHAGPLTRVGVRGTTMADNLAAWQVLSGGQDVHSIPGDPQMADPGQYDYHLKTEQTLGRRQPDGSLTSDSVSSPLLDAGNPTSEVSEEPAPNGNRVNIGQFGGTWAASVAPNIPWIRVASFGDQGSVTNGGAYLVWTAGGGFSNETARIEVSVDGGKIWEDPPVATNIPVTNGITAWTVAGLPDTPAGAWRVVCEQNTNVWARSTNFFSIRNTNLNLYVAPLDVDTNAAVYVSGAGLSDNWEASASAPLDSLEAVFDRLDLEPGDQIWVDNGTYLEDVPIWIRMKNSGTSNNPVRVTGNPASPFRGVVLGRSSRTSGAYGIQLAYASGVQFRDLMVSNAFIGVHMENSQAVELDRVRVGYCVTNAVYAGANVGLDLAASIIEQSLSAGLQTSSGSVVKVHNSLLRNNARANLTLQGGNIEVKNCVLEASGNQRHVYYFSANSTLVSDFNNIRATDGANVAGGDGRLANRFLIDWQGDSTNDMSSFGYAADFADEDANDFHPKSEYGRFDPVLGVFVTNDTTTSRLIDLGELPPGTYSDFSNEPEPNGDRVNVGLYGNTAEASKSSGLGSLVPLTMSDGGTIRGEATLYWAFNGIPGNTIVDVLFSGDGGITWTNIAAGLYADDGIDGLFWNTTNFPSTAMGVWQVTTTTNVPPIVGQTETLFAIKNDPLAYYINDGSTNGDVYCSAIGRSTNTGLSADAPLTSLETLFNRYKVEHGDTVYVDTGLYPRSAPLEIYVPSVAPTNYLVIQGSTNEAAGGSVFTNSSGGAVIDLQYSRNVELRDLRLHGGSKGLLLTQSSSNRLLRVRAVGTRGNAFELGQTSDQNRFVQCAALGFFQTGLYVVAAGPQLAPATNHWINGVISPVPATSNGTAVSTGALVSVQTGRLYMSNSVLVANGPEHIVFSVAPGVVRSDYNAYHRPHASSLFTVSGASFAFGVNEARLDNLGAWAEWNQSDSNSLAADALFADLAAGDLHPKSAGGRFDPATGTFVVDEETSPLIDTANPAADWSQESEPHGRRANLGVYGNTPQASRTPAEGTFVLLTLNQGGMVKGSHTLRWQARGGATNAGHSVYIQLSTNSGINWQLIGVSTGSLGAYVWNSTTNLSIPTARWRIQSQSEISWVSASERDFAIHNSNVVFYVNDASTNEDVYCTAAGSSTNTGLSPASPLDSLADVLSRYDLEAGDSIWVDTGTYVQNSPARVGYLDSGTAAEPVVIQGSTSLFGSVFSGAGVQIENTRGLSLKDLKFVSQTRSLAAAQITASEDISFEGLDIRGGNSGVAISTSSNVFLRNFLVAGTTTNGVSSQASFNTRLEFGTIWSNGLVQVLIRNALATGGGSPGHEYSYVTVSNCVLGAFGTRKPVYELRGTLFANYNDLYLANGALAALSYLEGFAREIDSVGSWAVSEFGQDRMSLSHDPQFADARTGDFHLKSSAGRFDPDIGDFVEEDLASENSPLIDAGDPAANYAGEPSPNGDRVNVGRYGGSSMASKTPTNGSLTLISFNDGGRASGTNVLVTWNARGVTTNATVTISYSADGGLSWVVLASNISAAAGSWMWDSTLGEQTVQGKLKIESEGSDGALATSTGVFSVRNAPFYFYVNDASTNNDVYCSAVGSNTNSGLAASAPMASLNSLLAKYDLEGGDVVYIDTGRYLGQEWQITQADSAGSTELPPVVFQGSTHSLVNGTVLDRSFNTVGIRVDYAVGVRLRNITVSNTTDSAVVLNDCYDVEAEWVTVGTGDLGFRLSFGSQLRVAHCMVLNSKQGVAVQNWTGATNTVFPVIEHNVFWNPEGYAIQISEGNEATVRHNIFSVASGRYVYGLGSTANLYADYNSIWLEDGGRVFYQDAQPVPVIYETVGSWAAVSEQDLHSYDGDPLLVDPTSWQFQLRSRAGRWVSGTNWVNDAVSSPLIDAGLPEATSWTNEPDLNGDRVNIGLYGGTQWASKSETNSALHLLSLNRGGVASGQVALNWAASGMATGHTVRLEVSIDDGTNWTLVAEGVPASLGGVVWNSLSLSSSPLALWRVQDEDEPGVEAVSEINFVLHNGSISYYVDDDSTANNVYCSVPGSSTHTGATPGSPKRWISEILETYNLEPGDVIYVDTGFYQTDETTVIGDLDAGGLSQEASQQVAIQGSTATLAGGSRYIITDPNAPGFWLTNTYGIRFSNLEILGATNGLDIHSSYFIAGEWLNIHGCENGANIRSTSNVLFSHSAMVGNRSAGILFYGARQETLNVGSSILWSNRYGIYLLQGNAFASNSIFGMVAPYSFGFYMRTDLGATQIQSDYNDLYVQQPTAAAGALQTGSEASARTSVYASVSSWTLAMGQDAHSLAHDPLLADPGAGDFHLKSAGGRYLPGSGWVYGDGVSSPLIDSGHPQSTGWTAEPDPSGRRLNIGLHGGTSEASKTPLDGWLTLVSLLDGGYAAGEVELKWTVGGAATNYSVCIEYSPDNGITWTNIVCGWPANTSSYLWDSVPYGRSAQALWRAYCVENEAILATSLATFTLRNGGTIPYYVNDASTNGDVYCSVPGDNANNGLTPATPKASLQAILDAYELAPEDVVYVDAGTYVAGSPPVTINQTDSGWSNLYVTIQGSTNPVMATTFVAPSFSSPSVFSLQYAVNVRLRNLAISNATVGLEAYQTIGCELDGLRIANNRTAGLDLEKNENFKVLRSVLWKNEGSDGGVAVSIQQGSVVIENSVLWGSPTAVSVAQGSLTVTNSVLDASGPDGRIYLFSPSASEVSGFRGDYNNYSRKNGALICEKQILTGGSDLYNNLLSWSAVNASDRHSMAINPAFANEITGDFHPKSSQGRFSDGSWFVDTTLSPLVDAGAPTWPYGNEPEPNGGYVNIGAYGNTAQASLTQTNPPWLRVISCNEEGTTLSGPTLLYWLHGGMDAGTPVRVEYSTDYEVSWHPIASNVPAGAREYQWDVGVLPLTLVLNWRVVSQADTNVWDVSDAPVSVKTTNYAYYVNDGSTNGDVWCSNPGLAWDPTESYGTNAATPLNSLYELLRRYPVGAGDRIFIDTGTYPVSSGTPIVFDDKNMGTVDSPLKIYGSTNVLDGGTLLQGNQSANGIKIQNSRYIELNNIRIASAQNGVLIQNADTVTMNGIESFNNRSNGISIVGSAGVVARNALLWKNGRYGYSTRMGGQALLNSTVWGNTSGAVEDGQGGLIVSNSILVVTNATPIYDESGPGIIRGNYNMFGISHGGAIGVSAVDKLTYANLRQWQAGNRDLRSVLADPRFVNPAAGDFHLQSRAGYWSNGTWAVSTNTSWAIDAGDPLSSYTNEPVTNGFRINLGAYGGTPFASKSDSSVAELLPATLQDGGVAPLGQELYWLYRGINATNLLQIEYSPDGGGSWAFVAQVQAGSAPYTNWYPDANATPEALWRIYLLSDTNVWGITPEYFTFRPKPLTYYVNDASTNGDVYCSAVGAATNLGYLASSPLHSIQAVLDKYQLTGGDGIKVDTGVFMMSTSVFVSVMNSGSELERVYITGSTNAGAGGTWLQTGAGGQFPAFDFYGSHYVNLSNFRMTGFSSGVVFQEGASDCTGSDLDIQGSINAGIILNLSQDIALERVLIREGAENGLLAGGSKFSLDGCVVWSNQASAVQLAAGASIEVTNSVIEASGLGRYCYHSLTSIVIQANYNNLFARDGAQIGLISGLQYEQLPQWVRGFSQDRHSLSTDPLFYDPANGDFHLRSIYGRYDPTYGGFVTSDMEQSLLIDMGSPRTAWSNEPAPNGGRRNIGLHGNTAQASKSDTNRWIQIITAMSGGILSGDVYLTWGYGGGIGSNEAVQLEYSFDDGVEWRTIVGNLPIGGGIYYWPSYLTMGGAEMWPSNPDGTWRIYLRDNTNVWDMTDTYFGLRNSPFKYYVNDASTNNDMYCDRVGIETNRGTRPDRPKDSLIALLRDRDLEPTDEVYVDTGTYYMTDTNTPIRWEVSDGGEEGASLLVRGSTHADRSTFIATNPFVAGGFFFMDAGYIDMRNLHFAGESMRFTGSGLVVSNMSLTNASEFSVLLAVRSDNSTFENIQFDRGTLSLSGQGNRIDRMQQRWGETVIVGTNVTMLHSAVYTTNNLRVAVDVDAAGSVISNCTLVSSRGTALRKRGAGLLRLTHNILVAAGSDSNSVIAWNDGALISDWNSLRARDSAWIGSRNGKWEKLSYWQAASGQDANSVSFEPRFAWEDYGDFHLKSETGRWNPLLGFWDVDVGDHSPVIDLGNPWAGTGSEIMPNGYRINLGAYGGTPQASKSRTNFWLTALIPNDGGVLKGTNVVLRWAAGNIDGETVRLQYSADGGFTWTNIATGLPAGEGSFTWDTTGFPDSFDALWRVEAEDGSGVSDDSDIPFNLRNLSSEFFVNDGDLADENIYCTSPGSDVYDGLTPATPKASLQAILDTYDLEEGDVVYLDTGVYDSTSNVRVIWSRSGSTNADVVIQGNTNGAHTILTRSGLTNYPAAGIEVKASQIQLRNLAIRGVNRGIWLESNRNVTVHGSLLRETSTGIAVEDAEGTRVNNSAFWRTEIGVSLDQTLDSELENLTFALPSVAGIRLTDTEVDILQNNLFIPDVGAYAYSIGTETSLLISAAMDYNLYDFGRVVAPESGFFLGITNDLRRWQLMMSNDYRSAIGDADLVDYEWVGDFHPRSEYGRWENGSWVLDTNTSWAVDHGNPASDYSLEPPTNGGRINIGMYGNTVQASQGSTNIYLEVRTLNEDGLRISQSDQIWPMVWSAHLVDGDEWVQVQFSGDGGLTWTTLTTLSAYVEYYVWQASIDFSTGQGRWRVIGVNDTNLVDQSDHDFTIQYRDLGILTRPYPVSGLMRFEWEGGIQGRRYEIRYSDDFGTTWNLWDEKYNGPSTINKSNFVIPVGGSQLTYTFEDRTSYLRRTRWYRIYQYDE